MHITVDITKTTQDFDRMIDISTIEDYAKVVILDEYESEKDIYVSLLLADNATIQTVNRDYRGKDKPTDVISFAYLEVEEVIDAPVETLGDIVISLERVEEQAKEYGHSFQRELFYVLTHGILHLLGYDHIQEEDKKIMRAKEEEILSKHGYTRSHNES
jgi:probable rRNA maturation factor